MSDDLSNLYSDIVMEHASKPSNKKELKDRTHFALGNNPMCGDKVEISLKISDNKIEDIGFEGHGCAFCMASTSLMTEEVKGQSLEFVESLSEDFCDHMLKDKPEASARMEANEELAPVMQIKRLPMRIKCVTLCWRALQEAIRNQKEA